MTASANGILAASALPASCGSDIRLIDGEIALGSSDFELVEGGACVVQDLMTLLYTDTGTLFYAPGFGAGLKRFIHAPGDGITKTQMKALILSALQAETRIVPESHTVKVLPLAHGLEASIVFEATDNPEPINLTLRIGEELEIYNG